MGGAILFESTFGLDYQLVLWIGSLIIDPEYLDAFSGMTLLSIISLMAWGLGYFGQPHILARFMAIRHPKDTPKAQMVSITWMVFGLFGAIFNGFAGIAYFANSPLDNSETMEPWLA